MTLAAILEERFAAVLGTLVPLNTLAEPVRQQLLTLAEVLECRRGQDVFREGDRDGFTYFLLEGSLELYSGQQLVKRITGGTADAVYPLAQLQPRQLSAKVVADASVLRLNRTMLEQCLAPRTAAAPAKSGDVDAEEDDWMVRMLQSELFSRIPAANIQRVFASFEPVTFNAGDFVIEQGSPGDYYYVITQGCCQVMRRTSADKPPTRLAILKAGDSFGEEALVSEARRNATVVMLTAGQLMRLSKEDFGELLKKPLLSGLSRIDAERRVREEGALWLDVRFPEEHSLGSLPESLNLPLHTLRLHAERLDASKCYIAVCDTGTRSSAAAFLLSERGFEMHYLAGGLPAEICAPVPAALDSAAAPPTEAATPPAAEEIADRPRDVAIGTPEVTEQVAPLQAALAATTADLEDARRRLADAEAARIAAEQRITAELATERARLTEDAGKARQALAHAQTLKNQFEQARAQLQSNAAQARVQESEWLEAVKLKLEDARRQKEDAETARIEIEQALQEELTRTRTRLEHETEAAQRALAAQTARLEVLEATHAATLARQLEDAERVKTSAENASQQLETDLAAARQRWEADLRQQVLAETAATAAQRREQEAALTLETVRVREAWEEARQMKAQAEVAREALALATAVCLRERQAITEAEGRLEEARAQVAKETELTCLARAETAHQKAEADRRLAAEQARVEARAQAALDAEHRLQAAEAALAAETAQARATLEESRRLRAAAEQTQQEAAWEISAVRTEAMAEIVAMEHRIAEAETARRALQDSWSARLSDAERRHAIDTTEVQTLTARVAEMNIAHAAEILQLTSEMAGLREAAERQRATLQTATDEWQRRAVDQGEQLQQLQRALTEAEQQIYHLQRSLQEAETTARDSQAEAEAWRRTTTTLETARDEAATAHQQALDAATRLGEEEKAQVAEAGRAALAAAHREHQAIQAKARDEAASTLAETTRRLTAGQARQQALETILSGALARFEAESVALRQTLIALPAPDTAFEPALSLEAPLRDSPVAATDPEIARDEVFTGLDPAAHLAEIRRRAQAAEGAAKAHDQTQITALVGQLRSASA